MARPRFAIGLAVGVGISAESVRAVGVAGDAVRWALELERSESESLGDTLVALLERSPLARWPRAHVTVAIGPSAVQVKRLTALPPLTDRAAVEAVVREGAGRFFLRNCAPLLTSGVRMEEPGTAWAAAYETSVVEEVERACRSTRQRITHRAIVPTAVALCRAVTAGREYARLDWIDGDVRTMLTFESGTLASIRRLPTHGDGNGGSESESKSESKREKESKSENESAGEDGSLSAALLPLGERAFDFADAYGATRVARDEPLRAPLGGASATSGAPTRLARRRLAVALTAFIIAGIVALAGPGLVAARSAYQSRARLASMEKGLRQTERAERELGLVSDALGEVAEFEGSRRSATMLLAEMASALPRGAALVAFHADSAGGTLVALSQRASQVTTALEKVEAIASPEIVGPVTRELAGSGDVERVTVRFRFAKQRSTP
jgi:hypothetical protein